jgi:glycosyltransferase involved in cell wall biosynthesis
MNIHNTKSALSVCLIARNEENMLTDCLESIKSIASEIILVDTGSTDRTLEIAESFGCAIFNTKWENDFAKARNLALSKASFPFILSIDADERLLNPEQMPVILENADPATGGWLVNVVSEARRLDGAMDKYVTNLLRLFRNNDRIRFTGFIHEQIVEQIINLGYSINLSPLKFLHLGYTHDPEQMKQKQLRNLEMLDKGLLQNPTDANYLFQKAKTYLALRDNIKAEEFFILCLKNVDPKSAILPQALNFGAINAFQMGNNQLAQERAIESLRIIPDQAFANYIIGETLSVQLKFQDALQAYQRMERGISGENIYAHIVGDYHLPPEQLAFRLGRCYSGLQQNDLARLQFEKGISLNPNETSNMVGLANIFFRNGELDKAREILSKAISLEPGRSDLKGFLDQVEAVFKDRSKHIINNAIVSTDSSAPKPQTLNQDRVIQSKVDALTNSREKISSNPEPYTLNPLPYPQNPITYIQNSNNVKINLKTTEDTSRKPFLTLSMIVKNEEKSLPGCLDSVKDVVDEIIIVDTGSTDRTKEIAVEYGAKVYDFTWINDFAAARNESLKHCTGVWIIYLDADERLHPDSKKAMKLLLEETPEQVSAYICTIESNHVQLDESIEKHRGGYPRLFRNYGYPKISFKGRVHEQIAPSLFDLGLKIGFSDIIIEHLGYNQSREIMNQKIKRNYAMLIDHVKEEPLNAYAWYQLGQTLGTMALFTEAERSIRFAIDLGALSDSVFASAAATMSQMTGNRKEYSEALYWAERSLEKAPNQIYAMNLKAYSLYYLNRLQEAELAFLEVLRRLGEKQGVPQSGFDITVPEEVVMRGLTETRKKMGKV